MMDFKFCSMMKQHLPLVILAIFHLVTGVKCWPEGTYGIPMPSSGCFQWQPGSRTQKTVQGSYASENNHLAGMKVSKSKPSDKITQYFCMKTTPYSASEFKFEKGSYCIYKKGNCPSGLLKGSVFWDDDIPLFSWDDTVQGSTGILPDGEYDRDTKIEFCCRGDGSTTKPIKLPTDYEFYLLRLGSVCQKVEGMDVSEEWVQWAGDQGFDRDIGTHPLTSRTPAYLRLYYCYYSKKQVNPTLKIVLFTALGVVCFIVFVTILIFIIRRCIEWRCDKESPTTHSENGAVSEPMMEERERGAIARPIGKKIPLEEISDFPVPSAPPDESRPLSLPPTYEESLTHEIV